jgi:hypothetical protein
LLRLILAQLERELDEIIDLFDENLIGPAVPAHLTP